MQNFRIIPILFLAVIFIFAANAQGEPQTNSENILRWHQVDFKIKWDRENPPLWFIDIAILDLLISPVVEEFESDIHLWRFHRRACNDNAGHMLSLIFYATKKTAEKIFNRIKSKKDYHIVNNYLETSEIQITEIRAEIEATSDNSWPMEIQKSWPYFIMGASKMFIEMIKEVKKEMKKNEVPEENKKDPKQIGEFYNKINEAISKKWRDYGQHAFFHHMEAIFGYEPINSSLSK